MKIEGRCEDITQEAFIKTKYQIINTKMGDDLDSTLCLVKVEEPGFLTENGYNSNRPENYIKSLGTIEIITASKLKFI